MMFGKGVPMKIPVSELLEECFDDQIHFQEEDEALDQNWKEHILEQIRQHAELQRKHRFTKYLLTGLVAAATVGTAFASGIFVMHKQHASPGETEKHNEVILVDDQTGETETEEVVLRDVAVSFTFTGEDTPNEVWIHPDYLPEEPEQLNPDLIVEGDPGWYQYLSGESGYTDPIPWQISVMYALADTKFVLLGEIEAETETDWDGLQVTEITLSRAEGVSENYVILFDPDAGYMVIVAGMLDTGELEKIAKGLDIRITDTPVSTSRLYTGINVINLGRG